MGKLGIDAPFDNQLNQALIMKYFSLLIVGLALSFSSYGQTIKIQAGPAFSSLDWKVGAVGLFDQNKIGFSAFVGIDYYDRKYYNLSSNIGFVSKGGKEDIQLIDMDKPDGKTLTVKGHLDYISFSTVVEVKYPLNDIFFPFISLGPRFDYLMDIHSSEQGFLEPVEDDMKKCNYGLIVGGGLKYDITKFQIGIQANYYLNFIKIADSLAEGDSFSLSINDNTTTLNFILGYKLN